MKIAKTWVDTLQRGSVIKHKKSNRIRFVLGINLGSEDQVRYVTTFNLKIKHPYKSPIVYLERSSLLEFYEKMSLKYRFTKADLEKEKKHYVRHGLKVPDYINHQLKEKYMKKDEIIEMAKQAGFERLGVYAQFGDDWVGFTKDLETFAKLVEEKERELVANWLMRKGFATGHGDTIVDMIDELEWQVAEREREACAEICDVLAVHPEYASNITKLVAQAIRNRGQV